ncbi:universal stress protein [Bacillus mojavensis]|uniref:universal stress protein n=1 Tax=Bacillus mojavensis TaxID=72360 RepID=UPI002DBD4A87|nr:universal stress protein [Bacillus mojavensis]MEC1623766.1 universal stress protein [Bacillus mojavensis]MEC1661402.1 universal stress protein [Bacillus mojavensis]
MYKNILCAADGLEHAIRIAKLVPDSRVEIIYVKDFSKAKSEVLHTSSTEELERERCKKLDPVIKKFDQADVQYDLIMKHGEPGPAIVSYTNMFIVGSRGLNSLQEMVLGSVSHKVAKRANCPVLIVK